MKIVTAASPEFEEFAENMAKSAKMYAGLDTVVYDICDDDMPKGSLNRGMFKTNTIRKAINDTDDDVLWLDSDMLVVGEIDCLDGCDIAITVRDYNETHLGDPAYGIVNTGFVYISKKAIGHLDRWNCRSGHEQSGFVYSLDVNWVEVLCAVRGGHTADYQCGLHKVRMLPCSIWNNYYFITGQTTREPAKVLHFKGLDRVPANHDLYCEIRDEVLKGQDDE